MSEHAMLAPCGIDCAACDIYQAAQDPAAAERLAERWRANGHANAEAGWFRCQGCRGDRTLCWCDDCHIFTCAEEKGVANCSQCADFPCQPLQEWGAQYAHHVQALEKLKSMAVQ